jgi:hypothetical protein
MAIFGPNKRSSNRPAREFQITINDSDSQVYTLDFSPRGLRLGGTRLKLEVGEQVKITAKNGGRVYNFAGQVTRNDGLVPIRRISRAVNVFYVMISGSEYQEFYTQLHGMASPALVSVG